MDEVSQGDQGEAGGQRDTPTLLKGGSQWDCKGGRSEGTRRRHHTPGQQAHQSEGEQPLTVTPRSPGEG